MKMTLKNQTSSSLTRHASFWSSLAKGLLTIAFGLSICAFPHAGQASPNEERISIMTYNAENLFDTQHDQGKNDYTYLPLKDKNTAEAKSACENLKNPYYRKECLELDWNDDVYNEKLHRVADVIQQINNGRGPDIQVLVEVENRAVLEKLRSEYLPNSNYKTLAFVEGPDHRGIDPAVLSRLPEWDSPRMHLIPFETKTPSETQIAKSTRGILEARLILPDGQKISVFALHFPSQANPSKFRKQAANRLNRLLQELPSDVIGIAAGDFNITSDEDQKLGLFKKTLKSKWLVSHQVGCESCRGTHYYTPGKRWSFLDAILFSRNMDFYFTQKLLNETKLRPKKPSPAQWVLDAESIRVANSSSYQINRFGTPARFNFGSPIGVSDHWPIYAEIVRLPKSESSSSTN